MTLLESSMPKLNAEESTVHPSAPDSSESEADCPRGSDERLRKTYRAVLDCAPDAIFVADTGSGRIIEANRAAANLLNTTVTEIVGRHQAELHPSTEKEAYAALFERHQEAAGTGTATLNTLDDGSPIYVETDDGRYIPVEINARPVELADRTLFVGIFRDITERRQRERELREAKEQAEEASRLKSAMLANVSHEIRTPLTSIIGFSKVLTQMLEGEPEEHADQIYQAAQHLMKTIHSILELSKLESGVEDLERRAVRLDEVAEWAVDLLRPQAEEKGVALKTQVPNGPVEALANREALNRIAENLLENAIKFTPEGGHAEIRVREEEEAILEVADTGIGVNPETVSDLFQAFKQESEGLNREHQGCGLGLSIVKELTDRLGGTIEVESQKGEGSRFTVRLPLPERPAE